MESISVTSYRDLKVWQKGMDLAEMTYRLTKDFPAEERFGMVTQMRRAAVSIPANIAEGWGRDGRGEYIQFCRIAQGSLKELETHLLLAERVGFLDSSLIAPPLQMATELGKMLRSLIRTLQS